MLTMTPRQTRKIIGLALPVVVVLSVLWWFSPGVPVLIGPWAWSGEKTRGQELFLHEWEPNDPLAGGDGLGPVFNAKSCAACHFQGGAGGAGANKGDVQVFHVRPTNEHPESISGMVHFASIDRAYHESWDIVRQLYPVVKGKTIRRGEGHCAYTITTPDFNPLRVERLNATALFGAGWIDLISSKAIAYQQRSQTFNGTWSELKENDFTVKPRGRARVLADGRIGKFGWKAQFATLEEFVASACANELGLSTPISKQPTPLGAAQYESTGTDMSWGQLRDLTAFVATLPKPVEFQPTDDFRAEQARQGKQLFTSVGCAICHVPDLGGVKGVYSDFLLHDIDAHLDGGGQGQGQGGNYGPPEPPGLPPLDPREPLASEWKTPPLWGVADTAPYFHDGQTPTIESAIIRHRGDATSVTRAYGALKRDEQEALIQFLQTLKAPGGTVPVQPPPTKMVAQATKAAH
jgi:CxxC motif-containing protein (DUF1111 family)